MSSGQTGWAKWLLLLLLVVAAFFIYQRFARNAEQRRIDEEIATAEGLAKVISETFQDKSELKVFSSSGKLDVTSVNRGWIFTTTQRAIIPYSVDYFVNLAQLGGRDLKYDPLKKRIIVHVPDVSIARPNIDEANIRVVDRDGWFRSPTAGENLAIRASRLAERQARDSAQKPQNIKRARDNARDVIQNLLRLPLNASGQDDIKVEVRFPTEGANDPSYLDLSTPYDQAIREGRQRRAAAEGKK